MRLPITLAAVVLALSATALAEAREAFGLFAAYRVLPRAYLAERPEAAQRHLLDWANAFHAAGDDRHAARCVVDAADTYYANLGRTGDVETALDIWRAYPDNLYVANLAAWMLVEAPASRTDPQAARAAIAIIRSTLRRAEASPPDAFVRVIADDALCSALDTVAEAQSLLGLKADALQTYFDIFALFAVSEQGGRAEMCAYYDRFGDLLYRNGHRHAALSAWIRAEAVYQAAIDGGLPPEFPLISGFDIDTLRAKRRALATLLP